MKDLKIVLNKREAFIVAKFLDRMDKEQDGIPSTLQSIGEVCWSFVNTGRRSRERGAQ